MDITRKPALATIPERDIQATEVDKIWHVTARMPGHADSIEVLTFPAATGSCSQGTSDTVRSPQRAGKGNRAAALDPRVVSH